MLLHIQTNLLKRYAHPCHFPYYCGSSVVCNILFQFWRRVRLVLFKMEKVFNFPVFYTGNMLHGFCSWWCWWLPFAVHSTAKCTVSLVISIDKSRNYDLGKAVKLQHILEQETGTPSSLPNSKSSCDIWCTWVAFCLCSLFFTHLLFMYI